MKQEKQTAEKLEYLENKSRQNNIRIHQVKEEAEGGDMVNFLKMLISEKLEIPADQLNTVAAHRSYQRRRTETGPTPRSIVVKFLTWETRQKVLSTAWAKKVVMYEESRIYFDQDYSSKIQKERSQYTSIRKELREKGVKSHLIYPAKLRVFGDGGGQVFNSAREAAAALHAQGLISGAQHLLEQKDSTSRIHVRYSPAPFEQRRRLGEESKTPADLLRELGENI